MSEYAGSSVKREKTFNLTPDDTTGELFTIEEMPVEEPPVSEGQPTDDPVELLIRERAAYEQVLRGQGRTEERVKYLVRRQFGPRIARLAIHHDVSRLLPSEPRYEERPAVYRDARSAAANDRLDD